MKTSLLSISLLTLTTHWSFVFTFFIGDLRGWNFHFVLFWRTRGKRNWQIDSHNMHICIYTHICMNTYMHIHIYACTYVRMYTYMHFFRIIWNGFMKKIFIFFIWKIASYPHSHTCRHKHMHTYTQKHAHVLYSNSQLYDREINVSATITNVFRICF